jgi:DNA repair photolyase
MTKFKGKAIYQPAGKAAEYAEWACNFYVGCSNGCTYCYLKKGRGAKILGGDKPTLKKCFLGSEEYALFCFQSELNSNLTELQEKGLFFSFATDPCLQETIKLTDQAISICLFNGIPVKILTKRADWVEGYVVRNGNVFIDFPMHFKDKYRKNIAFGFTLTGHDELEPGASTNAERIEAMKKLHDAGFKTFASIEPVVDFESSLRMIKETIGFCDLYKVGFESGKKYNKAVVGVLLHELNVLAIKHNLKIYLKESVLRYLDYSREYLLTPFVTRDYNIFK